MQHEFSFLGGASREVRCATKDKDGDILSVGGSWGIISKEEAIRHIESNAYKYYVIVSGQKVWVHVVEGESRGWLLAKLIPGKYLRTNKDSTQKNNLDDLPNCHS
jgi:hypothetical protein